MSTAPAASRLVPVAPARSLPTALAAPPLRVADCYAGIGGFHLAFNGLGAEVVWAAETDPTARLVYTANFAACSPELFRQDRLFGDVHRLEAAELPDVDVLCAGFPCQPFSGAGLGRGFADQRGQAIYDLVRILRVKQPAAFFFENVRGLVSHDGGRTFATILRLLRRQAGYSVHYRIVRASDHGLPQLRPRLFLVGFRDRAIRFQFPQPTPLQFTLSDLFGGTCDRDIGRTILASRWNAPHGDRHCWDSYLVNGIPQRLSVDHARQLQGFPDGFWLPSHRPTALRLLGNSVAVPAVAATAAAIGQALREPSGVSFP